MSDPQPTELDRKNAALRQSIAERQAEEYAEAMRLALDRLGPGWRPWMKICLIDADHRQSGDTIAIATVFKVYRGAARLSENSVYLRRMPDGTVRKADRYESLFGDLLDEKHPTRTVEVRGQRVPVGRYEVVWAAMELYQPRSAEELAKLCASRERRKAERADAKERTENPLFTTWAERNQEEKPGRG